MKIAIRKMAVAMATGEQHFTQNLAIFVCMDQCPTTTPNVEKNQHFDSATWISL